MIKNSFKCSEALCVVFLFISIEIYAYWENFKTYCAQGIRKKDKYGPECDGRIQEYNSATRQKKAKHPMFEDMLFPSATRRPRRALSRYTELFRLRFTFRFTPFTYPAVISVCDTKKGAKNRHIYIYI